MSMGDAVEMFDYWRDYPPVHLILRGVHMKTDAHPGSGSTWSPSRESQPGPVRPPQNEAEILQAMHEAQRLTGSALGRAEQMPQHLKELADYAEEMLSKMRPN